MREWFGNWGIDLSDADFARALAALGLLPPEADPSWPVDQLAEAILKSTRRRQRWRFRQPDIDAWTLVKAWLSFLEAGGLGVSISVESPGPLPLPWVERQLSRLEVKAGRVETKSPQNARGKAQSYSLDDDDRLRYPVEALEEIVPRQRFLQAQFQRQARACTVSIRVGLPDEEWRSVEESFPLAEDSDPEGHQLTVLFWESRVCPEPQVRSLWLPPRGSSQPVSFTFAVPRGLSTISARVTILHANRVLQTGLLQAEVGRGLHWSFQIDAAPRMNLESLGDRNPFDLALILSGDTPHVTASSEDQTAALALDDGPLAALTDLLDRQISSIAEDPDRYAGLESPGSVELLRSLAQIGAMVHDHLQQHCRLDRLADARCVHITSARAGAFLPIEFLYRFRSPDPTAGLCPHALAALEAGDCSGACPSDKRKTVCPLGFWGLSRVIERHSHLPEDQDRIKKDFEIAAEPARDRSRLPLSRTSLLAASNRASQEKKDAVTTLLKKLKARGASALATTWPEWEQHISSDLPGLLVLLPHHERRDGFEILAIGEAERLASVNIWDEVVRKPPDGPHPIVLLMGCETNLTRISFDNPVSRFRDRGAALVVSTIATILGRHASPATATLIDLLDELSASGDRTFGEVMLRLRQKLVVTQTPMALGLTAYGDADWVLTKEER